MMGHLIMLGFEKNVFMKVGGGGVKKSILKRVVDCTVLSFSSVVLNISHLWLGRKIMRLCTK